MPVGGRVGASESETDSPAPDGGNKPPEGPKSAPEAAEKLRGSVLLREDEEEEDEDVSVMTVRRLRRLE